MISQTVRQPETQYLRVELHRVFHVRNEYCGIPACDHRILLPPIIADLTHNGKSQFMEPLSSGIMLPGILLDRSHANRFTSKSPAK